MAEVILAVLPFALSLGLGLWGSRRLPRGWLRSQFALKSSRWDGLSVVGLLVTSWCLPYGLSALMASPPSVDDPLARMVAQEIQARPWALAVLFLLLALLAVFEEVLFRGWIVAIPIPGQAWRGVLVSAILFGFCHQPPWSRIAAALILSAMTARSRTLLLPIAAHTLANAGAFALGIFTVLGVLKLPQMTQATAGAIVLLGLLPPAWALRELWIHPVTQRHRVKESHCRSEGQA